MALHIVIDGYNLIGSEKGLRGSLESQRQRLISDLQDYHERKGYPVTVVFDGWRSGWIHEVEERPGNISVIFTRRGEKADSVVQRLASELGQGCVVVTSDRELREAVEASGAVAIYAREFLAKLKNRGPCEATGRLRDEKRGNPRRLSKAERKRRERLKKL